MKEQSKILNWILFNSCNGMIYGAIAFLIGKQNNNFLFQLWALLPYLILFIISVKFESYYRSHVFQNRFHRVLYWFCLVLQFVLGVLPSFNVFYVQPLAYTLMLIGQIIITVVIIKLWEQISKRTVFIPKDKIRGCMKWSDEIRENRDILFNKGTSYTKNLALTATWMGFGLIVVFFLYVILPFLFSLNHFYNNRNAVIALIAYLLFIFINHQKNTIFHTKINATKFDIIEDVSMLAGLCLSYYSAVISDDPGSINFIVLAFVGFSLYPFFYNNHKISEAYYKNHKERIKGQ